MITILLIIWLLFIVAEAYRNYRIIEIGNSRPDYLQSFVLRGMAAIGHGVLFDPANMGEYLPVFIFQVSSFWVLFPVVLNYMRQKPLLYYNTTSGWIARVFAWIGSDGFYFFCKILSLVVSVFAAIVLYTR